MRRLAPLGHFIMISSQPVLLLFLNAACLAEKQQIPMLSTLGLTWQMLGSTIYRTQLQLDNKW
jgi:hypothetical protein